MSEPNLCPRFGSDMSLLDIYVDRSEDMENFTLLLGAEHHGISIIAFVLLWLSYIVVVGYASTKYLMSEDVSMVCVTQRHLYSGDRICMPVCLQELYCGSRGASMRALQPLYAFCTMRQVSFLCR